MGIKRSLYITLLLLVGIVSCTHVKERGHYMEGVWEAKWETDPTGYPGLSKQLDFTMEGKFQIDKDSITIEGYGYKGCIFTEDTIHHKLTWRVTNDSLLLFNDPDTPGLVYKIVANENEMIKLQLEDIFVTLSR